MFNVPAPPVQISAPAPKSTFLPASTLTCPLPETISALTPTSPPPPIVSTKTLPPPAAETETPSANAVPSFNVIEPPALRITIDPPSAVRTSLCAESRVPTVPPSAKTRKTLAHVSSIVSASVSRMKIPPAPARALNRETRVSIAFPVPIPAPAVIRNRFAITSSPPNASPPSKIDPLSAISETFPPVVIPPIRKSPAAITRTSPFSATKRLASACETLPEIEAMKIVPLPPVAIPADPANETDRAATTETCPEPATIPAFAKTIAPTPPASTKTFPDPSAETAQPSAPAAPSFNVKLPANVRITIPPFSETVATSACAASVKSVTVASWFTRFTVTATSSTTNASVSKRLIPPPPARAVTVATVVRNGTAPTPNFPTPTPATKRNPEATTSICASPFPKIDPVAARMETFPPVAKPPTQTLPAACKRKSPLPLEKRTPSAIVIDPSRAAISIVPAPPVATSAPVEK